LCQGLEGRQPLVSLNIDKALADIGKKVLFTKMLLFIDNSEQQRTYCSIPG
jgi:hypothetical protein